MTLIFAFLSSKFFEIAKQGHRLVNSLNICCDRYENADLEIFLVGTMLGIKTGYIKIETIYYASKKVTTL